MIAVSAFGAWERLLSGESGERSDTPPPHNLSYYKASACADVGAKDRTKKCPSRTELKQIGSAGKFTLFDLDSYFSSGVNPPERFGAESLLLQSSPGVYHELLFRGPFPDFPKGPAVAFFPAVMAASGTETILFTAAGY